MRPERQSPVDIPAIAPRHGHGIGWSSRPTPFVIGAGPNAVQFECAPGSGIVIEGQRYGLAQFHFHCPGEHTFDGAAMPLELHLVHSSTDGGLAVVGMMLVEGDHNATLEPIVKALAGDLTEGVIDPSLLLPADRRYVAYDGSLTVPPYSEDVTWRVLTQPVTLSAGQLRAFESTHGGNNRPIQPLNGRMFT